MIRYRPVHSKIRQLPLFWQLVIPLVLVGAVSLALTSYMVFQLNRSINLMDDHYQSGMDSIVLLEQIEKYITQLRTITLKHLASETAVEMRKLDFQAKQSTQILEQGILELSAYLGPETNKNQLEMFDTLKRLTEKYDRQTLKAIRYSNDFEKERAFILFNQAEQNYISDINTILRSRIREHFLDLKSSHKKLETEISLYFSLTLTFGLINVAVLLAVAFILTSRISHRLQTILGWSRQFSDDVDLDNLPVAYNDEVGNLAMAINDMAQRIRLGRDRIISAKKLAEDNAASLKLYEEVFTKSGEASLITDKYFNIVAVNNAFFALTGYAFDEIKGRNPTFLFNGAIPFGSDGTMLSGFNNFGLWQGELCGRKKNGTPYPAWLVLSSVPDQRGMLSNYLVRFTDITDSKRAEEKIQYLAHHDSLTGLLNRFSLEDRLAQAILTSRREQVNLAVLFIDLDRFKVINDTYGHDIGDQFLVEVASRLQRCLRESDVLARLGGDEFVVALTGLSDIQAASPTIEKISRELSKPYSICGHAIHSTSSIGVSIFPDDGNEPNELMKYADSAMYQVKEEGRNNYQFYSSELAKAAEERSILENDFMVAMRENSFELYYQPQFAVDGIQLLAFEALLRWHHPERGMIPPNQFISFAEDCGCIEPLGEWVLNEACRQLSEWRNNLGVQTRVAINLSARQLRSSNLVDQVSSALHKYQLPTECLELEVTETVAMSNPQLAEQILSELSSLGVTIAIDDFGTGYSSFSYLKRMPIHSLKLDQSYVRGIANNPHDEEISAAIIQLAHNLGLKVVAEGVETEVQHRFMQSHQCDVLQGFLFSKPLPVAAATEMLSRDMLLLQARQMNTVGARS